MSREFERWLYIVTTCTHTCTLQAFYCRSWGGDQLERYAKRRKREQRAGKVKVLQALSYQPIILTISLLSDREVNYSKRQRVLAFARNHKKKIISVAGGDFLISLTQSSAPETVASTHLIESHDLTIWAQVSESISSPGLITKALNTVAIQWLNWYQLLLQPELKEEQFDIWHQKVSLRQRFQPTHGANLNYSWWNWPGSLVFQLAQSTVAVWNRGPTVYVATATKGGRVSL